MITTMPQWLSITIGVLLGCAIVFGAIFLAVRPYAQARPPKPLMPDPNDNRDDMKAWIGWQGLIGNDPPPSGGDGAA
jgi:hypothetical protein